MHIKRNSQPITISNEVEFEVSYDYYPAEEMVWRDSDGGGYPGAPATVEINAIYYEGVDILKVVMLNDKLYDEFHEEILNYETEY